MTPSSQRWLWRLAKGLVVVAILVAVSWTFSHQLGELEASDLDWQISWLFVAGGFYLLGSLLSALYWWLTLRALGQQPTLLAALRAYHIGHLGKYVPGKALVPILRTAFIWGPNVRTSVAVVSVLYETLAIMAAGGLLAAILAPAWLSTGDEQIGLLLLILAGSAFVLSPPVFNLLARRVLKMLQRPGAEPVPPLRFQTLLLGLGLGALNWFCVGASLWATVRAVGPFEPTLDALLWCTAGVCLATVVGFVTPSPGGLGVREWVLLQVLATQLAEGPAALAPLLLRVVMILTEVLAAGSLFLVGRVRSPCVQQETG